MAFFFMLKASPQWRWYVTVSLLPLPLFLARDFLTARAAATLVPWTGILLLLDAGYVFFRNPYEYWYSGYLITFMAGAGALMTLPNFVSLIDGDGALPEWRTSFGVFSRMFFASVTASFFTLLFYGVFATGASLAMMIGGPFARAARWVVRNFETVAFAAWGAAFCWTAGAMRLIGVLERYILAVFSSVMLLISVFTILCAAALPLGVERLWERGLDSGVVLSFFLASGFCAFAAWQSGVTDDGRLREPFFRRLNSIVKAALVILPIFSPLLIYAIGLRVKQYSLTVDRAIGMALAIVFGLWSLTWAFFLVRRWREWPRFYGKTNRIAFPVLGVLLILLSSPVCDVRRIVLRARLEWLRESIREGSDIGGFDWGYTGRSLGSYGVKAIEDLEAGGAPAIAAKFGPFESEEQAIEIRGKISAEAASIGKRRANYADSRMSYEEREKVSAENERISMENFMRSVRDAPVFGRDLTADEKEALARGAEDDLKLVKSHYGEWKAEFFFLTDMDGDGEFDVLMGIGNGLYLMRGGRAFTLEKKIDYRKAPGTDNKTAISEDRQTMIEYRWNMIRVDNTIFFVDPYDAEKLGPGTGRR
jgi:hypothetical protein